MIARMGAGQTRRPALVGVSDLHVEHRQNRRLVERLRPQGPDDWLVVCGDISHNASDVDWALGLLRERFAKVIWTPGNHELWVYDDEPELRGERRYLALVERCRRLDVLTPEDPYPIWDGHGGPVTVAPLFLLYDYSFGRNIAPTKEEALALADQAGVVCSDEFVLHPDPYRSREEWCHARVLATEQRLGACDPAIATVLVSHFPLIETLTRILRYQQFAQWCGTLLTADWHSRFRAEVVVYGHLHIPRTTWHDGVRFEEVSLGYPREWTLQAWRSTILRPILPLPEP